MFESLKRFVPSPFVYHVVLAISVAGCGGTGTIPATVAFEPVVSRPPARSPSGMVVSVELRASQVGRAVLRAGGNAVDAAIATGFALAVTHPSGGNIGGGGFMVIRFPDGRATAITRVLPGTGSNSTSPERSPRAGRTCASVCNSAK